MNEIENAIERFAQASQSEVSTCLYTSDLVLAISALEKQVVKKVVPTYDGEVLHCPNCDFDLMGCAPVDYEDTFDYCLKCAQRLEWE